MHKSGRADVRGSLQRGYLNREPMSRTYSTLLPRFILLFSSSTFPFPLPSPFLHFRNVRRETRKGSERLSGRKAKRLSSNVRLLFNYLISNINCGIERLENEHIFNKPPRIMLRGRIESSGARINGCAPCERIQTSNGTLTVRNIIYTIL